MVTVPRGWAAYAAWYLSHVVTWPIRLVSLSTWPPKLVSYPAWEWDVLVRLHATAGRILRCTGTVIKLV